MTQARLGIGFASGPNGVDSGKSLDDWLAVQVGVGGANGVVICGGKAKRHEG